MRILVTGGTGFIGAQVVRMLLARGRDQVHVCDINPSPVLLADLQDRVAIVRGDLGNFSQVLDVVKLVKPATIYHLGGLLSAPSDADPPASFRANAMGTFHILEAARLFDVSQVIFSSTIATYGLDIQETRIDDLTIQRPQLFYGATKVLGEHLGMFYKRKYGLDFRGVRYPAIVGPGVKTPGVVQYTSWAIEESIRKRPFTIRVAPETRCPVMYFKDAALAVIQLAAAPLEGIRMANYIIAGAAPIASARELADLVRSLIPAARITFDPDPELQPILDKLLLPIDDRFARQEWQWRPQYDQEEMIADFIREMARYPERYA